MEGREDCGGGGGLLEGSGVKSALAGGAATSGAIAFTGLVDDLLLVLTRSPDDSRSPRDDLRRLPRSVLELDCAAACDGPEGVGKSGKVLTARVGESNGGDVGVARGKLSVLPN